MSRSFKHTPRCGDRKTRFAKRSANRKVRMYGSSEGKGAIPQHMGYKRVFCRYDIWDYECVGTTWEQFIRRERRFCQMMGKPFPSPKELMRKYKRFYLNKKEIIGSAIL